MTPNKRSALLPRLRDAVDQHRAAKAGVHHRRDRRRAEKLVASLSETLKPYPAAAQTVWELGARLQADIGEPPLGVRRAVARETDRLRREGVERRDVAYVLVDIGFCKRRDSTGPERQRAIGSGASAGGRSKRMGRRAILRSSASSSASVGAGMASKRTFAPAVTKTPSGMAQWKCTLRFKESPNL